MIHIPSLIWGGEAHSAPPLPLMPGEPILLVFYLEQDCCLESGSIFENSFHITEPPIDHKDGYMLL